MLVGHEPDLSELVARPARQPSGAPFDKAMVVGLHLRAGTGRRPAALRARIPRALKLSRRRTARQAAAAETLSAPAGCVRLRWGRAALARNMRGSTARRVHSLTPLHPSSYPPSRETQMGSRSLAPLLSAPAARSRRAWPAARWRPPSASRCSGIARSAASGLPRGVARLFVHEGARQALERRLRAGIRRAGRPVHHRQPPLDHHAPRARRHSCTRASTTCSSTRRRRRSTRSCAT